MLACSKTFPSKGKKVNLKGKKNGAFYNILCRVRRFTVLICLPSQLNVPLSLVFPVYSHDWVRHMDDCAPLPFCFKGKGDACLTMPRELCLRLMLML